MEPEEYETQPGIPFECPTVNPPTYNVTIPNVASLHI